MQWLWAQVGDDLWYLESVAALLAVMAVCVIVGRALARLLPRRLIPVARLYYAPALGLALLVLAVTLWAWVGHGFGTIGCLLLTSLLTGLALLLDGSLRTLPRQLLWIAAISIIVSFAPLASVLRYQAYHPYNDLFTYLPQAQWLQTHGFAELAEPTGYFPALTQIRIFQATGARMGASFFLAYLQSLFGVQWSFWIYPAAASIPVAVAAMAVAGAVYQFSRRHFLALLAGTALALGYSGFNFGVIHGFYHQSYGLALAAAWFGLLGALIAGGEGKRTLKLQALNVLPLSICLAATIIALSDMAPFAIMAGGVALILAAFRRPNQIGRLALQATLILLQTMLLVNFEILRAARAVMILSKAAPGVAVTWPWWHFVGHALGLRAGPFDSEPWLIGGGVFNVGLYAAGMILCLIACGYLLRMRRRRSLVLLPQLAMAGLCAAAFLVFRFCVPSPWPEGQGQTWSQFKLSNWVSPSLFTLMVAGLVLLSRRRRLRGTGVALLFVLAGLGAWRAYDRADARTAVFREQTGYDHNPFRALLEIRQALATAAPDDRIYLDLDQNYTGLSHMLMYLLHDKKLCSDWSRDVYVNHSLPAAQRVLPLDGCRWVITPRANARGYKALLVGQLALVQTPYARIVLDDIRGGHQREVSGANWLCWTPHDLEARFHVLGTPPRRVRAHFEYLSPADQRAVQMTISSGQHSVTSAVSLQAGWHRCESPPFAVSGAEYLVRFHCQDAPSPISDQDPRQASYLIKNLRLAAADGRDDTSAGDWNQTEFTVREGEGGYQREADASGWWYWTGQQLSFECVASGPIKGRAIISFHYMPVTDRRPVRLQIADSPPLAISMRSGENSFRTEPVDLPGPRFTIRFTCDEPPQKLREPNPRLASFMIKNLTVDPE